MSINRYLVTPDKEKIISFNKCNVFNLRKKKKKLVNMTDKKRKNNLHQ